MFLNYFDYRYTIDLKLLLHSDMQIGFKKKRARDWLLYTQKEKDACSSLPTSDSLGGIKYDRRNQKKRKDLRMGADELDVRQLDPLQSVCPPMPDRKHRERNSLFLIQLQQNDKYAVHQTPNVLMYNTESAAPYVA